MIKENKTRPGIITSVFFLVNAAVLFLKSDLDGWGIDSKVIIVANLLLFVIVLISVLAQERSLKNRNPNAGIRMIMVSTFVKLMVLGIAAFLYLSRAGTHKSKYAVFIAMGLYLLYTWLEVRASLRMNKKADANH